MIENWMGNPTMEQIHANCRRRHEALLLKLAHHPIHLRRYILVAEYVSVEPNLWKRVIEFYEENV